MAVFLIVFSIVVFLPRRSVATSSSKTISSRPIHSRPLCISRRVWYFTPYYSILRATTENFMWALAAGVLVLAGLIIWSVKSAALRVGVAALAVVLIVGFFTLDPKVWGVVLMGTAVMIYFALPWLDQSPVRSIRYKGPITKAALALFVIAFFVLGYLGTHAVTAERTFAAQIGTAVLFPVLLPHALVFEDGQVQA